VDVLTDDILAVMEAVGSKDATILATYESAIVASLFAATYPHRTRSLILVDPLVTYLPTDDTPWMPSLSRWQEQIQAVRDTWGTPAWWDAPEGREGEWFSRYARASVTPGSLAAELGSYLDTDIRAVLPTIQVPTLIAVDTDSFYEVMPETGRFAASKIPGARVVEHSSQGGHHFHWYARGDAIVGEVRRFLLEIGEIERPSTGSWQPSSSPTSWARRSAPRPWATGGGRRSSSATRLPSERFSPAIGVPRSTRPVTAFSRPSTGRPAPSAVRWRLLTPSGRSASRSERGCIPVRSSGLERSSLGWR
jgi:hypothetical protein